MMSEERLLGLAGGAFFVLFGLLLATFPLLTRRKANRLKNQGVLTQGIVVSVVSTEAGEFGGVRYNEISLEYSDQSGSPIRFNKMAIGTREISEGSTIPVYYDPHKPKSMFLDLDAVTQRPGSDLYRQHFGQAVGGLFIAVGIATMLFIN